jgi:prephenate dehydrogenase
MFRRLAVLGLGLLGGSVALAARERGVVRHVVGYARRVKPLEWSLKSGVVDSIAGDPVEAVRDADFVVLATPVSAMAPVLQRAAAGLQAGAIVTDVGSVKAPLVETLPGLVPAGVHFVGSHPMAGSHSTGVENARADLFEGAPCVVTPGAGANAHPHAGALERVAAFWEALGARVTLRDPAAHDAEVAWESHLPHVLAFAYGHALASAPETATELAGSGFRDFVRIARSDAELWGDILGVNRKAMARPLQAFSEALAELAQAIEQRDTGAVEAVLDSARRQLDSVRSPAVAGPGTAPQTGARPSTDLDARSGGENPEIQAAPRAAATRSVNRNS